MFKFPPLYGLFVKFDGYAVDGDGRTTGGYTFHEDEHPRAGGGKFGDNGGPKPYIKKSTGEPSPNSEERVKEFTSEEKPQSHEEKSQPREELSLREKTIQSKGDFESKVNALYDLIMSEKEQTEKWLDRSKATPAYIKKHEANQAFMYDPYKVREEAAHKITKWEKLTNKYSAPNYPETDTSKARENFSAPELTDDQIKAINKFTLESGVFNNYLNSGSKKKSVTSARIDDLSEAINSSKTSKDVKVFRGINSSYGNKNLDEYIDALMDSKPGTIIDNKAFVSTSVDPEVGLQFAKGGTRKALLSISVPKGHPALYVGKHGTMGDQGEVLLDKGSRFRIDHIDKENKVIHASVVKPEPDIESLKASIPETHHQGISEYFDHGYNSEHRSIANHYKNFPEAFKSKGTQDIKLSDLHPSQDYVYPKGIKEKLDKPDTEPANVIKLKNGKHVLENGHHRYAAAKLKGEKTLKAEVHEPEE